jgi:hypothetical protein
LIKLISTDINAIPVNGITKTNIDWHYPDIKLLGKVRGDIGSTIGYYLYSHVYSTTLVLHPYTRDSFSSFSTAGLARMPAASLPLENLNGVVTKNEIEFYVQRHRYRHVSEKSFYTWHVTPRS